MAYPKLITILVSLKTEQWKDLKQYILSKNGKGSDNAKCFIALHKNRGKLAEPNQSEKIRQDLFSHMSIRVYQNMLSRLFRFTEEWLVQHQLSKERYQADLLLVKFYNRQGLFKLADQKAKQIQNKIDEPKGWNLVDGKAEAELLHQQYYSDNPIKYREGAKILENLVNKYLEQFKEQALLYQAELYNWGKLQNYDYFILIKEIESSTNSIPPTELIKQLTKLKELIETEDFSNFEELSDNILNHKIKKGSDLHIIITVYLIRYSFILWKNGKLQDVTILTKLYSSGFESGLLLHNGKIPLVRFRYICTVVSVLDSFDNTNKFILRWISKVDSSDIYSTKMIAFAQNCAYHNKEEDILELTRTVKFENRNTRLTVSALNIISLYKTRSEDLETLKRNISNLKVTIRRQKKKSRDRYQKGITNFLNVIERLIKRDKGLTSIDLNNFKPLQFRFWLQKQID